MRKIFFSCVLKWKAWGHSYDSICEHDSDESYRAKCDGLPCFFHFFFIPFSSKKLICYIEKCPNDDKRKYNLQEELLTITEYISQFPRLIFYKIFLSEIYTSFCLVSKCENRLRNKEYNDVKHFFHKTIFLYCRWSVLLSMLDLLRLHRWSNIWPYSVTFSSSHHLRLPVSSVYLTRWYRWLRGYQLYRSHRRWWKRSYS